MPEGEQAREAAERACSPPPTEIALVFVATDEWRFLSAALESLHATLPARPVEVVVVDNDSSDGVGHHVRLRWPQVRVLRGERRRGLYANLNLGIAATGAGGCRKGQGVMR